MTPAVGFKPYICGYQTSQNGGLAILRVQGCALPLIAEVI
jgi:hypothetical protein